MWSVVFHVSLNDWHLVCVTWVLKPQAVQELKRVQYVTNKMYLVSNTCK